jgi:hypothetical protein
MKRLLTLAQFCDAISVCKTRYYAMLQPTSKWYDPTLPDPIYPYGDTKKRFTSEQVEVYLDTLLSKIAA